MAGSRKSKGEAQKSEEKKEGGLDARPDGKVRWTKNMREALARFNDRPCGQCGGSLSDERSLADSLDFFRRHRSSFYPPRAARLRMLEMHGAAAAELLFEPSPHKEAVTDLLAIHDAEVVRFFVAQVKQIDCKNALVKQAARWPLFVLRELLSANPARHQAGAALILELLAANPEWQKPLEASCDEAQRKTLARLQEDGSPGVADAPADDWPALLRRPPWKNRQALPVIPVLALQPLPPTARLHWADLEPPQYLQATGDLSDWLAREVRVSRDRSNQWMTEFPRHQPDAPDAIREGGSVHKALWMLGLRPELIDDVAAGRREIAGPEDFGPLPGSRWGVAEYIWQLPAPLAVAAFTHGPAVDHFMGDVVRARPSSMPSARTRCRGCRASSSRARARCSSWPRSSSGTRSPAGSPRASTPTVGCGARRPHGWRATPRRPRAAWFPSRWASQAPRTKRHRPRCAGCTTTAMPRRCAPRRRPTAPKPPARWRSCCPSRPRTCCPTAFPRYRRRCRCRRCPADPRQGRPRAAAGHGTRRADGDDARQGRRAIPGARRPAGGDHADSLARFGRALLAWWIGNGRPARERWMFALQGRLGDGETARQLYGLLRQWRAALDRVRAYDAMAMLGEIGSDAALMHLAELARQTRYDDLRTRADRMLGEVAEQRGLSLDQLADRTVPDLGLDVRARLVLDFGPRSFEVRMDDSFQPVVHDAKGKALKTLPKPGANDDAGKAAAATTQLKELRKLAKTVATTQIRRLEAAMCAQRRWGPDEFMPFFANHPVLRVFSRPLVWGLFDAADRLQGTFRVTAEGELADLHDDPVKLAENARIGLPHPLDFAALGTSLAAAWGQVLADYELLQPFEQLARQSFVLDDALRAGRELPQWAGRAVSNAALMGLETRGWVREIGDGGMVNAFNKGVPGEGQVRLQLEEGWFVQDSPDGKALQTVLGVALTGTERTLGDLPAIAFSEIERDLQRAIRETAP